MSVEPTTPEPALATPNLTMAQLQYLVAVTEHPSWAAAAASLRVTPSALSQGLAELERRLGMTLFDRRGRRRSLRPDGDVAVDYARRVLAQTADLARWAARTRAGTHGTLRVGMIDAAAVHHFPEVLRAFRTRHPGVALRLTVAPSGELLELLRRDAIDLAVCVGPLDNQPDLTARGLLTEGLAVIGPEPEPFGPPSGWGPWVTFPAASRSRQLIASALFELGAPFDVVAESHQPEVLAEMVRLGLGWSVLPEIQLPAGTPRRHLVDRTLVAVQRADTLPNPSATLLLDHLSARLTDADPPSGTDSPPGASGCT